MFLTQNNKKLVPFSAWKIGLQQQQQQKSIYESKQHFTTHLHRTVGSK
jgi:hypothetical protein